MLNTHSRLVGDAIVTNAQSQEEKNLPTDKIIMSTWCQAEYRKLINKKPCELLFSFGTSGFVSNVKDKSDVFPERL